jgi:VanZ family protein
MKSINYLRYYWKSVALIACIFYLSFAPPSAFKGVPTFQNEDKLVHFLLYFCLTLLIIYDSRKNTKLISHPVTFVLFCLLFPTVLGGLVEIFQKYFFPPRTAEWTDWLSDSIGAMAGWFLMCFLKLIPKSASGKSK